MDFNTFYNKILTDENMMETIQHGRSDYPFRFYYDNLTLFDFHCVEWHWHVEFEFLFVEKGTAVFWAGEKQFVLEKGQGFFVNSKILHRFYSEKGAVIPNFVFVPTFIAPQHSLLYKKYVEPLEHATLECLVFTPAVPWQAEVLAVIKDIIEVQKEEKENELKTSFLTQKLWHLIYSHTRETVLDERKEAFISPQARLQLMMQYIHQHFDKKLSQCWEGVLASSCNTYTISNPSWGGSIKDGSSITVNGACEDNSKDLKIKNIKIEVN